MAPAKKKDLPKPLPEGFILKANDKTEWRLGKIIGQGGFGLIYLGKTCLVCLCLGCGSCLQPGRVVAFGEICWSCDSEPRVDNQSRM